MKSRLYEELRHMLRENGIEVKILNQNPNDIADFDIILDFSEHDKKVAEEKDKRIAELERDLKECKDEVIAVRKNRDEMMEGFRNGIKPYVDLCQMHERIAELEKENNALKEKLSLIRTRATAEARDFWDKDMFGSLLVTIPKKFSDDERVIELEKEINEKNNSIIKKNQRIIDLLNEIEEIKKDWCFARMSELEDRHQSDCIRINQLLTTIDVLTERYQKLREVHGL